MVTPASGSLISVTAKLTRQLSPGPHLEVPHEVYFGEWQDALPAISLCDVQSADPDKLPAGIRNPAYLLRSQMLRRSLQKRGPASRKTGAGVMNS
jgi:hypothetical protein